MPVMLCYLCQIASCNDIPFSIMKFATLESRLCTLGIRLGRIGKLGLTMNLRHELWHVTCHNRHMKHAIRIWHELDLKHAIRTWHER